MTLSFDDGFVKSSLKVAQVYERFGLSACFNVVATGGEPDFCPPHESLVGMGDWGLWNELVARGHEVMPHGLRHEDFKYLAFAQAREMTLRCLDMFEEKLSGFDRGAAVYNVPFNRHAPEMEAWLPEVVRAFRTGGGVINPLPTAETVRLSCESFGPEDASEDLDRWISLFLTRPEGWLIYNTHGVDGEGWGPIGSVYLERLLERLVAIPTVRVMPAGRALPPRRKESR